MLPDLDGFFVGVIVAAILAGVALAYAVPWLWGMVKPLLHALTA